MFARLVFPLLVAVVLIAPPVAPRAETLSPEQMEQVIRIKQARQRRMIASGLRNRAPRTQQRLAAIAAARAAARADSVVAARHGAVSRPVGARQRPARERAEDLRDRAAQPLRAVASQRAQEIATNVPASDPNLDDPTLNETQSETTIAAWGNNVVAAWNDGHGQRLSHFMGYGVSTNGGQSFTDRGGVPAPTLPPGIWTSDPVLTVNEKTGDFYFCGLVDIPDVSNLYGVAVIRGSFSGGNFSWGTPRVARFVDQTEGFIDKPWIVADSTTGNLYLTYTRFAGAVDSIVFIRSTNQGLSWGPQITMSSAAAAGWVQGSRPAVGPNGEVYVVWKEINQAGGLDFFRLRKSTNAGVSFGPEITAATMADNFGSGAPGFNRELGITFPSISVDRSNGPRRGRVYLTWNESVNYYDSVPDADPPVAEVEPNDSFTGAQTFTPGVGLFGSCSYDDFDYYQFTATQGRTYVFWAPGPDAGSPSRLSQLYSLRIFCSDRFSRLAFTGDTVDPPGDDGFLVWTAPATGTYYLRIVLIEPGAPATPYEIRTSVDQTPGEGGLPQSGRDHRDIFVRWSADGTTWSNAPVLVNDDPALFDNWLPEVAVAADGTVYATWYDFSDSPAQYCGAASHAYVARSDDGGATWLSLGAASSVQTHWTQSNDNIIPNQGDYIALFADGVRVYPCWADGRFGNSDAFTAPFLISGLQVAVEEVVADTGHVAITWRATGTTSVTASVQRKAAADANYTVLGTIVSDAQGRLFYDDTQVTPGTTYQYKLVVQVGGQPVDLGQRTVTVPTAPPPGTPTLALAAVNPTAAAFRVTFGLPTTQPAWLTLFDVSGRRLREWDVSSMGAGPHTISDFAEGLGLEPGVYVLRLTQGEEERRRRVVLLP
jgi:hypothetical protein